MKKLEILQKLSKCDAKNEESKCYWKNGTDRLARHRVATNLQIVKKAISAKLNKTKCNSTRYASTCHVNPARF